MAKPEQRDVSGSPADARNALRRRRAVGIVLIAVAILGFALLRADWRAVFPPGWWRW